MAKSASKAASELAKARAKKLPPARRSEIAAMGAAARLKKAGGDPEKLRQMTASASKARRKSKSDNG